MIRGLVRPMLATQWHQNHPFNDLTPNNSDAGCVAIAVAQIMAYHEFPKDFCIWSLAKTYGAKDGEGKITNNELANRVLATLSATIGRGCEMKYTSKWSFSTPLRAKKFMRNIGYRGTYRHIGYDEEVIISSLQKDCPVFIGALDAHFYGHAWVLDGYALRERVDTVYCASNPIEYPVRKQFLLHCNWGWKGSRDGYYVSKVFDSKNDSANIPIDLPGTRGGTGDYTWWFRIVTYDKPHSGDN